MSSTYSGYKVYISATTNTTPIQVTTITPHGRTTADVVLIDGTTDLADGLWSITVIDSLNFTLDTSTAPGSTTSASGQVTFFPPEYAIPSDGDVRDAASVNVAFEAEGDRTQYLSESRGVSGGLAAVGNSSGGVGGAVQLANNQFPKFPTAQSRLVCKPIPAPYGALPSGWIFSTGSLSGPNDGTAIEFHIPSMHDGATIDYVELRFRVTQVHSDVPVNLPGMSVSRQNSALGTGLNANFLSSVNPQPFTPTPGSGTLWRSSENFQGLRYTCDQFNVVDTSQYIYIIALFDEYGTNSIANSSYFSHLVIHYTNIPDIRWFA